MHGNNTNNLPVYLSLSQTSKNAIFFPLSFMFFLLQSRRTRGKNGMGREVTQIMYTHVNKCKNNKIKLKKEQQ
jgi:hypothetical protein